MPVTKTAKRALRSSKSKKLVNDKIVKSMEVAVRTAKKSPTDKNIRHAVSLVDKTAKKNIIHKNKAARMKSSISKYSKKPVAAKSPKNK